MAMKRKIPKCTHRKFSSILVRKAKTEEVNRDNTLINILRILLLWVKNSADIYF